MKTTILSQMILEILVAARKKTTLPLEETRKQRLENAVGRRGLLHQIMLKLANKKARRVAEVIHKIQTVKRDLLTLTPTLMEVSTIGIHLRYLRLLSLKMIMV